LFSCNETALKACGLALIPDSAALVSLKATRRA
jgi:hypothetical protein